MLRDKQKKISHFLLSLLILMFPAAHMPLHAHLTSLTNNDAIPMFSTLNIDEEYLLTRKQLEYKFDGSGGREYTWLEKKRDRVGFSLSPFAQNADRGKSIKGQPCIPNPQPCPMRDETPLGDLTGRTGMIALLYNNGPVNASGPLPQGQTLPPVLQRALDALFEETSPGIRPGLNDEANIDPMQQYGYFSFPLKYRKRGVGFQLAAMFAETFGILVQTRVSTIRQVRQETLNLTSSNEFVPITPAVASAANVNNYLMRQLEEIADEIHINMCDFISTSMEEVRVNLFWRQAFPMNEDAENEWSRFLLIPYVEVGASGSPGKLDNEFKFFAAPFGNNRHTSIGFTTGINIDFLETIEIGGEIGYTHFFKRTYCRPVPNNEYQTNLFPFSTEVTVRPGDNWYFGARIAAYHFLEHLSMYFEWFVLDHQRDSICLVNPDPAFVPEVLECASSFKTKLGNAGFNYDLSPNVGIGFLWQIPFSQRNAYRSSTIMAGLNVTF